VGRFFGALFAGLPLPAKFQSRLTANLLVAPVLYAPMSGDIWTDGLRIAGRPEPPAKEDTSAGWARAMPGFFETIGAKMDGRPFTESR
jgi:hypothetical protein